MVKHMENDKEDKRKFSKVLPNNQIIHTCHIELRVQEMTMNEKLTMMALCLKVFKYILHKSYHNDFWLFLIMSKNDMFKFVIVNF